MMLPHDALRQRYNTNGTSPNVPKILFDVNEPPAMVSRIKNVLNSQFDRKFSSFPEVTPIVVSHADLPCNYESYEQTNDDFGLLMTPFIRNDTYRYIPEARRTFDVASRVARCANSTCHAYINKYCDYNSARWTCSLCKHRNTFSKGQSRYRNLSPHTLPELQDELVDFRMPLRDDVSMEESGYDAKRYGALPTERPLVHVFLVQESMQLDALQAVVEALTTAVTHMHPEVHVALVTYSHRIGIYKFAKGSLVPAVQYVPFVAVPTRSAHTAAGPEGTADRIFEGHSAQELPVEYAVQLMLALGEVMGFRDAACPVGTCRDALLTAVSSLFDAFPADGGSFGAEDAHLPKGMLGPAMEAVAEWITGSTPSGSDGDGSNVYAPSAAVETEDGADFSDAEHFGVRQTTSGGDLVSLFSNLTMGVWSSVVGGGKAGGSRGTSTERRGIRGAAAAQVAPSEGCTGVVMHIFVGSAQDLPDGSHASTSATLQLPKEHHHPHSHVAAVVDPNWTREVTTHLLKHSITVNAWGVANFEGQELGLCGLQTLVTETGGVLHRSVLGLQPAQERARLAEAVRRSVVARQATRCVLKVRGPNLLEFLPETISGGAVPDTELPGVFRLASCSVEKTVGMQFRYNVSHKGNGVKHAELMLQMAFSYETLAETPERIGGDAVSAGAQDDGGKGDGDAGDSDPSLYTDSSDEGRDSGEDDAESRAVRGRRKKLLEGRSNRRNKRGAAVTKNGEVDCTMRSTSDGYFERSTAALDLEPLQAQVAKHYHVADATLAARRQAQARPKYVGVQDGLMLQPYTNMEGDLSSDFKLLVVKYLRIYTVKVTCALQPLQLLADVDVSAHIALQMRRALRLDLNHRLNRRYTPEATHRYRDVSLRETHNSPSSDDTERPVRAFADKVNLQSPGVTYLVNSLVKRIITITREYAKDKQQRLRAETSGKGSQKSQKGAFNQPATTAKVADKPVLSTPEELAEVLNEVMGYGVVKDMLIYTFAAIDKLTFYTPTVGVDGRAYLSDDGCYLESLVATLDAVNAARLLHPLLSPVSEDLRLGDEFLPLTRQAIVTSAQQYFLLDAGTECLLYRSSNAQSASVAHLSTGTGTQSSASTRFDRLLEVVPLEQRTLETCANAIKVIRKEAAEVARRSTSSKTDDGTLNDIASKIAPKATDEPLKAAKVVNLMYEPDFLLAYLQRRLTNGDIVPRVQLCEAGSATASIFAAHLLEDHSSSGLSYADFVQFVVGVVQRDFAEV